MDKHPIENMMSATLENIRDMVDVNTAISDPIQTADGSTVIPLSRVSFGFVAGGGEYTQKTTPPAAQEMPFAGGTGAGVTSFSSTGAIGLFSAVINITMLFIANTISNKLTDTGLW